MDELEKKEYIAAQKTTRAKRWNSNKANSKLFTGHEYQGNHYLDDYAMGSDLTLNPKAIPEVPVYNEGTRSAADILIELVQAQGGNHVHDSMELTLGLASKMMQGTLAGGIIDTAKDVYEVGHGSSAERTVALTKLGTEAAIGLGVGAIGTVWEIAAKELAPTLQDGVCGKGWGDGI